MTLNHHNTRHYYDEAGDSLFKFTIVDLKRLDDCFPREKKKSKFFAKVRSECIEAAVTAEYHYGCTSILDTEKTTFISNSDDDLVRFIKILFLRFVNAGFIQDEFKLLVWDLICELQIEWAMNE